MGSPGFRDSAPPSVGVSSFPPPPPSSPVGGREGARLSSLAITSSRVRTSQSHPGPAVAAPHTQTLNQKGSRLQLEENPQKAGKVLGVALLLLENMCPISLREADNNAKPWSQPSSFPSPLPGSPRLPSTPRFPRPPHPCAQPLQKQLRRARATPRLGPAAVAEDATATRIAGPRRAGLPLCLLKLLLAAMTAPRAAGRGVRVRERAGWWGGRTSGRAPRRRRLSRGRAGGREGPGTASE